MAKNDQISVSLAAIKKNIRDKLQVIKVLFEKARADGIYIASPPKTDLDRQEIEQQMLTLGLNPPLMDAEFNELIFSAPEWTSKMTGVQACFHALREQREYYRRQLYRINAAEKDREKKWELYKQRLVALRLEE